PPRPRWGSVSRYRKPAPGLPCAEAVAQIRPPATGSAGVATVITLGQPSPLSPSAPKACVSRRRFKIHLRTTHGQRLRSARVYVDGRRVRVLGRNRLYATI